MKRRPRGGGGLSRDDDRPGERRGRGRLRRLLNWPRSESPISRGLQSDTLSARAGLGWSDAAWALPHSTRRGRLSAPLLHTGAGPMRPAAGGGREQAPAAQPRPLQDQRSLRRTSCTQRVQFRQSYKVIQILSRPRARPLSHSAHDDEYRARPLPRPRPLKPRGRAQGRGGEGAGQSARRRA